MVTVNGQPQNAAGKPLAQLLEELGYQAVQAQPVDLFPRTAHVETVLRMERRNR